MLRRITKETAVAPNVSDTSLAEKKRIALLQERAEKLLRYKKSSLFTVKLRSGSELTDLILRQCYNDLTVIGESGLLSLAFSDIESITCQTQEFSAYSDDQIKEINDLAYREAHRNNIKHQGTLDIHRGPIKLAFTPGRYNAPALTGMYVEGMDVDVLCEDGPWHEFVKTDMVAWRAEIVAWHQSETERKNREDEEAALELIRLERERLDKIATARETFAMAEKTLIDATIVND